MISFPLRTIHQIEMTSRCNLRCRYCPSPKLQRPKVDMEWEVFERTIEVIRQLMFARTQEYEVNLAGIGESTLHPSFRTMVAYARLKLGNRMRLLLATNGLLFDDSLGQFCASQDVHVYVSMHRPEKAGPAIEIARKYNILHGASSDPSLAAINWAGQVEWHHSAAPMDCKWVKNGWAMVMSTGHLTSCSMDASGIGVFGHIHQAYGTLRTKPYGLCRTCHQELNIPGYNQRGTNDGKDSFNVSREAEN